MLSRGHTWNFLGRHLFSFKLLKPLFLLNSFTFHGNLMSPCFSFQSGDFTIASALSLILVSIQNLWGVDRAATQFIPNYFLARWSEWNEVKSWFSFVTVCFLLMILQNRYLANCFWIRKVYKPFPGSNNWFRSRQKEPQAHCGFQ